MRQSQYMSLVPHTTYAQESTYSMQRHTLSWLLLISFLLCCCVTAPSGSNSQSRLCVYHHCFLFYCSRCEEAFHCYSSGQTLHRSFSLDFQSDVQIFFLMNSKRQIFSLYFTECPYTTITS